MAQTHAFDALSNILANTLSEPLLESTANALRGLLALPNDSGFVHADDYTVLVDRIAGMLESEPWSESACMTLIRLAAEACEDGAAEDTSKRGASPRALSGSPHSVKPDRCPEGGYALRQNARRCGRSSTCWSHGGRRSQRGQWSSPSWPCTPSAF